MYKVTFIPLREAGNCSINPDPVPFAKPVRQAKPNAVADAVSQTPDKVIFIIRQDGHQVGGSIVVLAETLSLSPSQFVRDGQVAVARKVFAPTLGTCDLG